MKIAFEDQSFGGGSTLGQTDFRVFAETDKLTDVLLCAPEHISPVPCCSVTRESLRNGFESSATIALQQHAALRQALEARNVRCHLLGAEPDMPDLCFTRDSMVATPWGPVGLRPAMKHREAEARHAAARVEAITRSPVRRISRGSIEGGDICVARPGLLFIGVSGERTDDQGAEEFAAPFRADGWDVLLYRFDPHFLHLDTVFCMVDGDTALVCTDVVDDWFMDALEARGIAILPVTYKEARRLGCNILSIDGRTIVTGAGTPSVSQTLRDRGYDVIELEIDQFAACGGGIHCLTMPLRRVPGH